MAAETDYIRVEDGDITIQGAPENSTISGSPATYVTLGCPVGNVTINDTKEKKSVATSDWCSAGQEILNQYRVGNRDVSMSFSLQMDLSDAGTKAAYAAYKAGSLYFIKVVGTDNNGTPNSITHEYGGYFNQFSSSLEQDSTAKFNCEYFVTQVDTDGTVAP